MDTRTSTKASWRSLLFVPADNDRFVEKACAGTADAIILDLEDAVLFDRKDVARQGVARAASSLAAAGKEVLVRINRPFAMALRDLEACIGPHVCGLVVAKTEGATHLGLLTEVVEELEAGMGLAQGHTRLVPLVESAQAVMRLEEIAAASRVVAIVCGDEDLSADLACDPSSETMLAIKHRLVLAAAAAEVRPIGLMGSIGEFRDLAAYQACLERSQAAGLKGTLCIHPAQVDLANRAFTPSESQILKARRIVEAADQAKGRAAAVGLDGAMIDAPVVRRAQALLAAAARNAPVVTQGS
jgi:citrate lyase subunit beta / citryl-CoA lyase